MERFSRAAARVRDEGPVGHGPQVERAVQLVRRGTSVAIVGERWSGRTTTLEAICRGLEDQGRVVRRVPSAWRRTSPRTGGKTPVAPETIRTELAISELEDALEALVPDSDVVVIDDVDRVPESSREVLRAVHRRSRVPFVTTRLAHGRRPEAGRIVEIALDPVELALDPLSFEDLHVLLEGRLDGRLSPELTARVQRDCAGLPGLAVAYLEGAITTGAVREVAGVWVGEDLWSPDLHGQYGAVLAPLSDDELVAAEVLARTGTVPVEVAERMLDVTLIDALEDRGLIQVVPAGGRYQLTLRPPGLTEHLVRRPMSARLLRTLGRAATLLATGQTPTERAARQVLSRIDSWTGHGSTIRTRVPEFSERGADVVLEHSLRDAREVAVADWQRSRSVPDAVRLLHTLGDDHQDRVLAESVLSSTDPDTAQDEFEPAELRYLRARFAIMGGQDVREVADALSRAATEGGPGDRALGPLAYLLRVEFLALPPDYEATLSPLLHGGRDEARAALVALAACRVIDGQPDSALELLVVERSGWPRLLAEGAELVIGLAEYASGEYAAAVARGSALVANGTQGASASACVSGYLVAALGLAAQGRLDQARSHLIPALPLTGGWSGLLSAERSVRGMLVFLSMLSAHDALAPGFVELVDAVTSSGDALPFGARALPEAMELRVAGSEELAAEAMAEIIRDHRSRGLVLAADVVEVVRLVTRHDPALAQQAPASVRRIGGRPFEVFRDSWQARAAEDPDALMEVAARFDQLDLPVEAARDYAIAAGLYRQAGHHTQAGRARRAIHTLQSDPDRAPNTPGLTDREREIIGEIARGSTNAQIAAELLLSVRTVETHVRNIRRKTGLQDREAIGRLAD